MGQIEIVYFSGYGHTVKQAEAIAEGAGNRARLWKIDDTGAAPEGLWEALDNADAIIFGSPTYMGGPAWQMKKFIDETSKAWVAASWSGKLFGGFTNSASTNGDKEMTMLAFSTLAAQHGGLWVSLGQMPANTMARTEDDENWAGGSFGPLATSPSDSSPDQGPSLGDLKSAKTYGRRIAALVSAA